MADAVEDGVAQLRLDHQRKWRDEVGHLETMDTLGVKMMATAIGVEIEKVGEAYTRERVMTWKQEVGKCQGRAKPKGLYRGNQRGQGQNGQKDEQEG